MYRDSDVVANRWFAAAYIASGAAIGIAMAADAQHARTTIMDPYGQVLAVLEVLMIVFALIGYWRD